MSDRIKLSVINDHIWLLNDNNESTGYLVVGKNKALIIDTMNGYVNVKELAESLTDLPLVVVNTHGHFDHIYGNIYFDKVLIHPADIELAVKNFAYPEFSEEINKMGLKPAEFEVVNDGDIIDLGELELEVYETPGHTPGGIVLLDRKDRILFTGDSIIEQTWMQMEESLPMEVFLKSLNRLQSIRKDFDYILTGHSRNIEDGSLYEAHKKAVEEVCKGIKDNDEPYSWFGGSCMAHPYGQSPRRIVYK